MNILMAGITSLFLVGSPVKEPALDVLVGKASYSLENRYSVESVNEVFKDNILLTLAYMRGAVQGKSRLNWEQVRAPFTFNLVLKPGETFAFHDRVFKEYEGKITYTTNAHFNYEEGFRSDGYLVGDGVCHLASFMNVVAKDAGLLVVAPTRHDFAKIEDVERIDGVSINSGNNPENQNLYITNNKNNDITFIFKYDGESLSIQIEEIVVN